MITYYYQQMWRVRVHLPSRYLTIAEINEQPKENWGGTWSLGHFMLQHYMKH